MKAFGLKDDVLTLQDYAGNLLLCGINYDKETKKHTCIIEPTDW